MSAKNPKTRSKTIAQKEIRLPCAGQSVGVAPIVGCPWAFLSDAVIFTVDPKLKDFPVAMYLGSCGAERVVEFLFAVVHWLLVGRDSKQDALDFLQDRAVQLAGRRDRGKLAEEAYRTAKENLEAVLVDQLAQIMSAPSGGED